MSDTAASVMEAFSHVLFFQSSARRKCNKYNGHKFQRGTCNRRENHNVVSKRNDRVHSILFDLMFLLHGQPLIHFALLTVASYHPEGH